MKIARITECLKRSCMKKTSAVIIALALLFPILTVSTAAQNRGHEGLEGIWRASGYQVGMVRRDSEWIAFIISSQNENWKAGDIKFRLKADGQAIYFRRDHSAGQDTYLVSDDSLIYFHGGQASFVRERPAPALTPEQIDNKLNEIEGFYIRRNPDLWGDRLSLGPRIQPRLRGVYSLHADRSRRQGLRLPHRYDRSPAGRLYGPICSRLDCVCRRIPGTAVMMSRGRAKADI